MTKNDWLKLHAVRRARTPRYDLWPLQLGMGGDPWRVMATCCLLNQTRGKEAAPVLEQLLGRWWDAAAMAAAKPPQVHVYVEPLGFGVVRSHRLVWMAEEFLLGDWTDITEIGGVGEYCHDALRIFCLGDTTVRSSDKVLAALVAQLRGASCAS